MCRRSARYGRDYFLVNCQPLTKEARRRSGDVARLAGVDDRVSAARWLGHLGNLGNTLAFTLALAVAVVARVARVSSSSSVVRQTAPCTAVTRVAGVGTVER